MGFCLLLLTTAIEGNREVSEEKIVGYTSLSWRRTCTATSIPVNLLEPCALKVWREDVL